MKEKKLSWNDITYRQFQELKDAFDIEDEADRVIAIAQIVYGEDVINKPLNEFKELCKDLDFIKDEIPVRYKVTTVAVNGRTYYFDGMLDGVISTAQYVDFQNHCNNKDEVKQFSVFFIPEGHKYNDGYDMMQVFEDIQDMPITFVMSASFFFVRQLEIFIRIFQRCSKQTIQNLKIPRKQKKLMKQMITSSVNLASYPIFSSFVK